MENTIQDQEKREGTTLERQVEIKQKKCLSTAASRKTAAFIGIALALVAILSAYVAGKFDSYPDLPEIMEGEATFTTDDGEGEHFHIMIDYKKKVIQLTSFYDLETFSSSVGRRLMSFEENKTANGTAFNGTKIVIQDFITQRKYFIVPENGKSTTKCIYTDLEGEMIPRHLLKHATLKSESVDGNMTHILFQVDNDTDVDVYRAKGRYGKIYEIFLHLPNGTVHMRSKEQEMNFTDYKRLNCYRYIEENDTIEESFYHSNDSKLYQESIASPDPWIDKNLRRMKSFNKTQFENETKSLFNDTEASHPPIMSRRRRGIGWRNGFIDWWYANWCGPYQGGYTDNPNRSCKPLCDRTTSYVNQDCRNCLPPLDTLDDACMEHDRCIIDVTKNEGDGPWWCQPIGNPCRCDTPFVWRAFRQIFSCSSSSCRIHAFQVFYAFFNLLSCWFPIKLCFPWIKFVCRCKWCSCPIIEIHWRCIVFKMCAFFLSGIVG